uniref:Receptor protein serine/threonine kinase n=1 Tax=Opuntia streptacantha TaxID=393608 RepID=A0A7C9ABX7_OPUST
MLRDHPTLIFSLLFLSFFFCNFVQPSSANPELRALMNIKAALDPGNKLLRTWTVDGDPCGGSFEGVACNDRRKVANISLQGRGLAGKLSPAIGDLKDLSGLYLHYNALSGEIPREIASLTQLTDLYLNFNNFSGSIPPEIGHLSSLQEMDLCCNQLRGSIPSELGSLSRLGFLSLQYNQLSGGIPPSLGNLGLLKRLTLSYNHLSGPIPTSLANIQQLQILDVQNNSLSGAIPTALGRLDVGFSYGNNTNLCGTGFPTLRTCTTFDTANVDINRPQPFGLILNNQSSPINEPKTQNFETNCAHGMCSSPNRVHQVAIVAGVITASVTLAAVGFLAFIRNRRQKQKVGTMTELSESGHSTEHHPNDLHSKSASPLVSLAYSAGWDPLADGLNSEEFSQQVLQSYRYNLEEVESATQYFSEGNVLGRGKFSTVYKGILRDGSVVAIKSINVSSCKAEEEEFVKGMNLLVSLRHENLVSLRGFCCSRGRGECFLIYDYAPNGNLLRYLDASSGSDRILNWSTRVKIIHGIAKGLHYLHQETANKPSLLHQNISAEKILIDRQYNPVISDSGIRKILADDTIFSALKVSAAMGYLAPEYITTGRFTEKSDVYAFGVVVLHIVSGKQQLTNAMRSAAESCKVEDFVDQNLNGNFSISEASNIVRIGLSCTQELPDQRPNMEDVVRELN